MSMTASSSGSAACVVNETYFPHLFLIPAGIIIIILGFLRRRRSFMKDVFGGRPGLVIPIDFLGIDHDRLAIVCVFGAATASVMNLIIKSVSGQNPWETAFLTIGIAVETAVLYYPYFACLASYHRIIGAMMGLPYVTLFLLVNLMNKFQKCKDNKTWDNYVVTALPLIPKFLCHLFIMGKFVIVLYKELKTCAVNIFYHQFCAHQVKLVRPWLKNHVKDLIKPRPSPEYKGTMFILRKIYNPEKNFKFSTQFLSVVMICVILLYSISILILFLPIEIEIEIIRKAHGSRYDVDKIRGLYGCVIATTILAAIFCVFSFIRLMENHKNNMLRMFKGDKSFIPKTIRASQFMIGEGLKYHSYQIGYFLWGYILLFILFLIICCFFYALSFPIVQDAIVSYVKGGGVVAGVAVITGLSLPLASFTIFRDYSYSKSVISIDNRNVYLVLSYFWFFIGLPMGFFSATFRILKAMAVGAVMLPRIDHSVMPDGFQQLDQGFVAYICYLHVQTAFRNPVLRVFCQTLSDEIRDDTRQKWVYSPQARNRWFLALTLIRNPQLASERKPDMKADTPEQAGFRKCVDVEIEVCQYGADNSRLVQDK